ncbi:type I restriction enzyme endonuclease domain-containing protein [Microbulbifer thermotolerans]|uniref:type I restriction enzyme endonuclease domain-containing protein n=1 Tax=Microbulbifer thermotolerans TaxID=252514 RepID=UPI000943FB2C
MPWLRSFWRRKNGTHPIQNCTFVVGLSLDEVAFYDAQANNESAVRELGGEILKKLPWKLLKACANTHRTKRRKQWR